MKDYTTPKGASELAAIINDYWLSRTGCNPRAVTSETGYHPAARHSISVVRSMMVNGYPPGFNPAVQAAANRRK